MNFPKGETRLELLNRAFIYGFAVTISVFLFIQVKGLIFDLFVAVVLAALAEPVVYRLSKKFSRKVSAVLTVVTVLLVIGGILFALIPIIIQEVYLLTTQLPNYFDEFINFIQKFILITCFTKLFMYWFIINMQ